MLGLVDSTAIRMSVQTNQPQGLRWNIRKMDLGEKKKQKIQSLLISFSSYILKVTINNELVNIKWFITPKENTELELCKSLVTTISSTDQYIKLFLFSDALFNALIGLLILDLQLIVSTITQAWKLDILLYEAHQLFIVYRHNIQHFGTVEAILNSGIISKSHRNEKNIDLIQEDRVSLCLNSAGRLKFFLPFCEWHEYWFLPHKLIFVINKFVNMKSINNDHLYMYVAYKI
jgi:hypothetical protein